MRLGKVWYDVATAFADTHQFGKIAFKSKKRDEDPT